MGKLSIEEKAKAYDEAIKRGLDYIRQTPATEMVTRQEIFEHIFPELKSVDDETIKKEIISALKFANVKGIYDKHIAWLEKIGEKNPNLRIDNSRAKVVFPFKARLKLTYKVVTINGGQLSYDGKEWIKYQSNKEDGYKLYAPEDLEYVCNGEQNSTWSEEDDKALDSILNDLRQGVVPDNEDMDWLKSLKDRVQPTANKEWSEDDRIHFGAILSLLKRETNNAEVEQYRDSVYSDIRWFTSLKNRACSNWKPSKEQMIAIDSTLQYSQVSLNSYEHLNSLYNDLKKLTDSSTDNNIVDECTYDKSAWTEEDERIYIGLDNLIYSTPYCDSRKEFSEWLKSLKERLK